MQQIYLLKNKSQNLIMVLMTCLTCLIFSLFFTDKVKAYTFTYEGHTFDTEQIYNNLIEEILSRNVSDYTNTINNIYYKTAYIDKSNSNKIHFSLYGGANIMGVYDINTNYIFSYNNLNSNEYVENPSKSAYIDSYNGAVCMTLDYYSSSGTDYVFEYIYDISNNTIAYNILRRTNIVYNNCFKPSDILYTNINISYSIGNNIYATIPYNAVVYDLVYENTYLSDRDGANKLTYFDIYVKPEDFQKQINFKLELTNYNQNSQVDYMRNIPIDIVNFDYAYLTNDNGMYKWHSSNDLGLSIDYSYPTIPDEENGQLIFEGTYFTDFDTSLYNNVEMVKIGFWLSGTYNYNIKFYSDSSLNVEYDEYMNSFSSYTPRLYRNFISSSVNNKYMFISTQEEEIENNMYIEYVNNKKSLYRRYFDTELKKYVDEDFGYKFPFFIQNRDIEPFYYKIGLNNKRGIYLINYLYGDNNFNSGYYVYLPDNVYYSYSNLIVSGAFYNNQNIITYNVEPNPKDEKDDLSFKGSLEPYFEFLNNLTETREFFNSSFSAIYYSLPVLLRTFIEFLCHILCLFVLAKMLGWSEN